MKLCGVKKNGRYSVMRKSLAVVILAMGLAQTGHAQQSAIPEQRIVEVKKTSSCGCCVAWIGRLTKAGFKVVPEDLAMGQLMRFKLDHGITAKHASCHTGRIAGYTIEGHVPIREIKRLLTERPDAIGLSVPGMPLGSPGMDFGEERDSYDVLLINKDGSTSVYASYAGTE